MTQPRPVGTQARREAGTVAIDAGEDAADRAGAHLELVECEGEDQRAALEDALRQCAGHRAAIGVGRDATTVEDVEYRHNGSVRR